MDKTMGEEFEKKFDLETLVSHKNGTKILVDGCSLQIGDDGVLRGVSYATAEKLLQNPSWVPFDGKSARRTPKGHTRASMQMALIGADGSEHPKAPPPPTEEEVKAAGYSDEAAAEIVAEEERS